MSTSHSCEQSLRNLAEELIAQASDLRQAADVLEVLRNESDTKARIKEAKEWAKSWLK